MVAITNAVMLLTPAQTWAACGPLAAGTYNTTQSCTPTSGVDATLSTQAPTSITTTAGSSILSRAASANTTISLSGTSVTSTPVTAVSAVLAQITGAGTGNAAISLLSGANSVTVSGSVQDAIGVSNANSGTSTVTVNAGSTLDIRSTVVGTEHDGIDISGTGGGAINLQHNGSGLITTFGGNGVWLKATGLGGITAQVGSGVSFVVDTSDPLSVGTPIVDDTDPTAGAGNHAGIHTRAVNGNTSVVSAATIRGTGVNANGIMTEGGAGDTQVFNSGSITTDGLNGFGIRAFSTTGSIAVVNDGAITTTGGGAHGIYANDNVGALGTINIENNGAIEVGNAALTTGSRAIYVIKRGTGDVGITGSGDLTVHGGLSTTRAQGILVSIEGGNAAINYSGDISASGAGAGGIRVDSILGNVAVDYSGNRIETFNGNGNAIYASNQSATSTVRVTAAGTLITHSDAGGGDGSGIGSFGIQALSGGGDVAITYTGPLIDVNGQGAAILGGTAFNAGTGVGSVTINNGGTLLARGNQQRGIRTLTTTGQQLVVNRGTIETRGATNSQGILAEANGAADLLVSNTGNISSRGTASSAIDALTVGGSVEVVNSAALSGGWDTSTGVSLAGLSQVLNNTGSIVALSDNAVRADANGSSGTATLNNGGQILGSITATASATTLINQGSWTLRNFADSTGSGTRDIWGIAVSNLGTAGSNRIDNSGLLSLAAQPASGITTFDTTGVYLPLGQTANTPQLGGPVQAQLLGANQFTNSGVIDLTGGGRAVGNVLVIGGGQTAGVDGGGVFVSNGGSLILNTELNEGDANSRSDMLVVDATQTGSGGATRLTVRNVGGLGALTKGNGIAVVDLLNGSAAASAVDAFSLGNRVVAGPYEYRLARGAEDGSTTDTWFLRSDLIDDDPTPNYRPEVSLYGALPALTLLYGRAMVDTLHERVGEERLNPDAPRPAEDEKTYGPSLGWGRVIYRSGKQQADRQRAGGDSPEYNYDLTAFQLGADLYRKTSTDGSHQQAGLSIATGTMDAGVKHYTGNNAGDDTVRGYSLGGYWTWFDTDGWYLDAVLQLNHFDIKARPNQLSNFETNGWGYTASLESGYPFEADKDLYIEPQAQLIYSYVDLDDSHDDGARVRFNDVESLIGRLGVRIAKDWFDQEPDKPLRRTTGWIRPSVWHEFKGEPKTEFSSETGYIPFNSSVQGTTGEVNLGIDYQADARTTFTASAGYQQSFDGDSHGYDVMVGFKMLF
ncbi:autotransporter outer membrane beta-barrel domain-containing protein [Pseudomonas sp. TE3786]